MAQAEEGVRERTEGGTRGSLPARQRSPQRRSRSRRADTLTLQGKERSREAAVAGVVDQAGWGGST